MGSNRYFYHILIFCVGLSVLLSTILIRNIEKTVLNDLQSIEFVVSAKQKFKAVLLYGFKKEKFSYSRSLMDSSVSWDTLRFVLPNNSDFITKHRLDFGHEKVINQISIEKVIYRFNQQDDFEIEHPDIFDFVFFKSGSVELDRIQNLIVVNEKVIDYNPYIEFQPIPKIIYDKHPLKVYLLILPFLLALFAAYYLGVFSFFNIRVDEVLFFALIVSIPLKIAWTSFVALILCARGIGYLVQNKGIKNNILYLILLLSLFLIIMILGRSIEYAKWHIYLALPIFAVISLSLSWSISKIINFYLYFFIVLNTMILVSGVIFLIEFKIFYGLDIWDYFENIKLYSGNIRDWLFYGHPAFLSFFGLIGVLFLSGSNSMLSKRLLFKVLYHILLLFSILLLGARIGLLIYAVFVLNIIWKIPRRIKLALNMVTFTAIAIFLLLNIDKWDRNRSGLWKASYLAIKQAPWFGYGLGSSEDVIRSNDFVLEVKEMPIDRFNHSHNQFITVILELGIAGFIFILLIFLLITRKIGLYKNETFTLFCYGVCYLCLTESVFKTSKPFYILTFLFLLISINAESRGKSKGS